METNTIAVDYENNSDAWWQAARAASDAPAAIRPLLAVGGADSVEVAADELPALLAWCAALPGWDGGPEHAPHPVTGF